MAGPGVMMSLARQTLKLNDMTNLSNDIFVSYPHVVRQTESL